MAYIPIPPWLAIVIGVIIIIIGVTIAISSGSFSGSSGSGSGADLGLPSNFFNNDCNYNFVDCPNCSPHCNVNSKNCGMSHNLECNRFM